VRIVDLGLMPHHEAETLQLETLAEVQQGAEETLFFVEHPKVITLGRQGGAENLHVGRAYLEAQGIELAQTRRGGNITCHFPGQLVAYPVFRVEKRPGGIRQFFFDMEEAVIRTTAAFGVNTARRQGFPGVWTGSDASARKICSMGIGVKRFVTYHGLALNVAEDVSLRAHHPVRHRRRARNVHEPRGRAHHQYGGSEGCPCRRVPRPSTFLFLLPRSARISSGATKGANNVTIPHKAI
jgi:Lipoate-protein ligase B